MVWYIVVGVLPSGVVAPTLLKARGPYPSRRSAKRLMPPVPGAVIVAAGNPKSAIASVVTGASEGYSLQR